MQSQQCLCSSTAKARAALPPAEPKRPSDEARSFKYKLWKGPRRVQSKGWRPVRHRHTVKRAESQPEHRTIRSHAYCVKSSSRSLAQARGAAAARCAASDCAAGDAQPFRLPSTWREQIDIRRTRKYWYCCHTRSAKALRRESYGLRTGFTANLGLAYASENATVHSAALTRFGKVTCIVRR